MKLSDKKYWIIAALLGVAIILTIGYISWSKSGSKIQQQPKPTSTAESQFLLNDISYECSKPINGQWIEANIGGSGDIGYNFQPADEQELKKYCREAAVIEYHAVLDILKRPDVAETIEKYDTSQAWVRALNAKYIKDKDYMHRTLPAYKDMKIHCVIVVHSPDGTRYFIEDGNKNDEYVEIPEQAFLDTLYTASQADITAFWLGLH